MVGFSRLMEADEVGTIERQKAYRTELIDPKIAERHGRIVKTTGDGLLVEFASVVDAVESALGIQQAMAEHEAATPEDRRIQYRVGINLGDIVIDGDDILGDGVNVAARLQEASPNGGLMLSGVAYESLGNLVDAEFEDGGRQQFKNITRPIQVWRWMSDATLPTAKPANADEPLQLPDKPSIAVLPFDNMSGDPEQEYFADGITEDIITALSRFRSFFVIARNSTFAYKGEAVNIAEVGRELGVRYVVEGSVRKASNRMGSLGSRNSARWAASRAVAMAVTVSSVSPKNPAIKRCMARFAWAAANSGSSAIASRYSLVRSALSALLLTETVCPCCNSSQASRFSGRFRRPRWRSCKLISGTTATTIFSVIWSCKSKTSSNPPSKRSAQRWLPVAASISCAVIRTRLPALRTLPSTT
jgi:hypothetical protein